MTNKPNLKIIQGGKEEISDKEFQLFLDAFLGDYKGSSYLQE